MGASTTTASRTTKNKKRRNNDGDGAGFEPATSTMPTTKIKVNTSVLDDFKGFLRLEKRRRKFALRKASASFFVP